VAGCDRLELRAVIETLGARRRPEEMFTGRVPVALASTRLERCVVGEPLRTCRARFERAGRRVSVEARTAVRFRIQTMEPGDDFERRLADEIEGDRRFELGRRVRERVLTAPEVCVREQTMRRVRVEQSFGRDVDVLALLDARSGYDEMVFTLPPTSGRETGHFSVRCAAAGEMTALPPIDAEGPCGSFAAAPSATR